MEIKMSKEKDKPKFQPMDVAWKKAWVEALRSGEYKYYPRRTSDEVRQYHSTNAYCVLLDLFCLKYPTKYQWQLIDAKPTFRNHSKSSIGKRWPVFLFPINSHEEVQKEAGITRDVVIYIAEAVDDSLETIADWIEKTL
jgi:hypothetical protein